MSVRRDAPAGTAADPALLTPTSSNTLNVAPNYNSSPDSDSPEWRQHIRQARKPSPGLAARLKALGFGNTKRSVSNPATAERIGRIPEDQIRQLDENHQANSISYERRARAHSGASNRPGLTRQNTGSSFASLSEETKSEGAPTPTPLSPRENNMATLSPTRASLDSHKYRMPEHDNTNGTKAMPDTRKLHLEREVEEVEVAQEHDIDETPPPPPKDPDHKPSVSNGDSEETQSYFNPFGLTRTTSIYTLSRASFASQLAQLTALQLPDAATLSGMVAAIPTSTDATKVLMGAAGQIGSWIAKASEVLNGLDADDDVEWAAIGGREGLEEVDNCVKKFEKLINVYVGAIEQLQARDDISNVSGADLQTILTQVENILHEWGMIKFNLKRTKVSVEMALEYEELCNVVLGDIGSELDTLARLIFEMEEKRHQTISDGADAFELGEMETIAEDTPSPRTNRNSNRLSVPPLFPTSPNAPVTPPTTVDDGSLLALFARMQPLRASLDFLPMRLQAFLDKAEEVFPSACEEIEERRQALEQKYQKLQMDAESLRRELGEDRWITVFTGAGRKASKMCDSCDRSLEKLHEALDASAHLTNPAVMAKKIEAYETKKQHYGPAIERVLQIIARGVKDRLTVNGEILRLHSEIEARWESLQEQMKQMDGMLEEAQHDRQDQQLRDSICSFASSDRTSMQGGVDTPQSSPASSVIFNKTSYNHNTLRTSKLRNPNRQSLLPQPGGRRVSSNSSNTSRNNSVETIRSASRRPNHRLSMLSTASFDHSSPLSGRGVPMPNTANYIHHTYNNSTYSANSNSSTPTGPSSSTASMINRPRWNSSVNTNDTILGHHYAPFNPSSNYSARAGSEPPAARYSHSPVSPRETGSKLPVRSPLSKSAISASTQQGMNAARMAFRDRLAAGGPAPGPYSHYNMSMSSPPQRTLRSKASVPAFGSRRTGVGGARDADGGVKSSPARPASSLAAPTQASQNRSQSNNRASVMGMRGRQTHNAIHGSGAVVGASGRESRVNGMNGRDASRMGQRDEVNGRNGRESVSSRNVESREGMRRGSSQVSVDSRGSERPRWRLPA